MRKTIFVFTSLLLMLSLAACSTSSGNSSHQDIAKTIVKNAKTYDYSKVKSGKIAKGKELVIIGTASYSAKKGSNKIPKNATFTVSNADGSEAYWVKNKTNKSIILNQLVKVYGTFSHINKDTGMPIITAYVAKPYSASESDQQTDDKNTTTDIFTAAKTNKDFYDEDEESTYTIKGTYIIDGQNTDNNNMYTLKFGTNPNTAFILSYAVKLAKSQDGTNGLLILEQGDNTKTGEKADYQGTQLDIITNTAEEIGDDNDHIVNGGDNAEVAYNGPVKNKGYAFIKFNDNNKAPTKLTITFSSPYRVDVDVNNYKGPVDPDTDQPSFDNPKKVIMELSK